MSNASTPFDPTPDPAAQPTPPTASQGEQEVWFNDEPAPEARSAEAAGAPMVPVEGIEATQPDGGWLMDESGEVGAAAPPAIESSEFVEGAAQTSYVEPETVGNLVTRALVPGALVLVASFAAVGGFAFVKKNTKAEPAEDVSALRQSPDARSSSSRVELMRPDGQQSESQARASIGRYAKTPADARPTVPSPAEPGELPPAESFDATGYEEAADTGAVEMASIGVDVGPVEVEAVGVTPEAAPEPAVEPAPASEERPQNEPDAPDQEAFGWEAEAWDADELTAWESTESSAALEETVDADGSAPQEQPGGPAAGFDPFALLGSEEAAQSEPTPSEPQAEFEPAPMGWLTGGAAAEQQPTPGAAPTEVEALTGPTAEPALVESEPAPTDDPFAGELDALLASLGEKEGARPLPTEDAAPAVAESEPKTGVAALDDAPQIAQGPEVDAPSEPMRADEWTAEPMFGELRTPNSEQADTTVAWGELTAPVAPGPSQPDTDTEPEGEPEADGEREGTAGAPASETFAAAPPMAESMEGTDEAPAEDPMSEELFDDLLADLAAPAGAEPGALEVEDMEAESFAAAEAFEPTEPVEELAAPFEELTPTVETWEPFTEPAEVAEVPEVSEALEVAEAPEAPEVAEVAIPIEVTEGIEVTHGADASEASEGEAIEFGYGDWDDLIVVTRDESISVDPWVADEQAPTAELDALTGGVALRPSQAVEQAIAGEQSITGPQPELSPFEFMDELTHVDELPVESTGPVAPEDIDPEGDPYLDWILSEIADGPGASPATEVAAIEEPYGPASGRREGSAQSSTPEVGQGEPVAGDVETLEPVAVVEDEGPKSILRRVDPEGMWMGRNVPLRLVSDASVRLTPNAGNSRIVFKGGEIFEGRLHQVGGGKVVLDTRIGRMSLDGARVAAIQALGQSSLAKPSAIEKDTTGLEEVQVRAAGGIFVGHLVSQEGDRVTLLMPEGYRMALHALEVKPLRNVRAQTILKRKPGETK